MCDFNNKITLALSLAEKGDLTQAEKICSEILDINPRHIQGRHLLAYIFIQKGDLPTAIKKLLYVIGDAPNETGLNSTLSKAHMLSGDADKALFYAQRELQINSNSIDNLIDIANIFAENGVLKSAQNYCSKALSINPADKRALELEKTIIEKLDQKCFGPMDELIPKNIGRGKHQIIATLRIIGRMGHLIIEPFFLKCLYDPNKYDIIFILPPRTLAVSLPVFDLSFRDIFFIEDHSPNDRAPLFHLYGNRLGTHTVGERTYFLEEYSDLFGKAFKKISEGDPPYRAKLNDEELAEGSELKNKMGIPEDASIVTVFVREQGYLNFIDGHGIRDSNIKNYIEAIKYLVGEGYYVVRIGDKKMAPLPDLGPQVIDTPFHSSYTQLVEPYFVSQSAFMLKTVSGPDALSLIFGIPSLFVNAYVFPSLQALKGDMCVFKTYYSHLYQRELSLREIAYDKDILFSIHSDEFAKKKIELLENSSEEILASTVEMVSHIKGTREPLYDIDQRFKDLCKQIHYDCKHCSDHKIDITLDANYFGPYLSNTMISYEFCKAHPNFLS